MKWLWKTNTVTWYFRKTGFIKDNKKKANQTDKNCSSLSDHILCLATSLTPYISCSACSHSLPGILREQITDKFLCMVLSVSFFFSVVLDKGNFVEILAYFCFSLQFHCSFFLLLTFLPSYFNLFHRTAPCTFIWLY